MKTILVMQCAVLSVTSIAWSAPSGIDLLSQQHHVWGYAGGGYEPPGVQESYNLAGSRPIFGSATGIEAMEPWDAYPVTASSYAGFFRVEAHGYHWTASGYAESVYILQPGEDATSLTLYVGGERWGHPFEVDMELTLMDLATTTVMENFSWPDWDDLDEDSWYERLAWSQTYPIDPEHTYSLRLYAAAYGGDIGESDCYMRIGLNRMIPAPGAILLGVLGTGLVGWLRRRRVV